MPELPEVETVARTLENKVGHARIVDVEVRYAPIVGNLENFADMLKGQSFEKYERRGKYLVFRLTELTLVSHLRMEGKYFVLDPDQQINEKHVHVIFHLDDGRRLCYNDTRKFGRMEVWPKDLDTTEFHDLGLEPFDENMNGEYLKGKMKNRDLPVKQLLLDQSIIAGIGNIYADEICFACGLHPETSCRRLRKQDFENIAAATRDILGRAIEAGGTTIRSYTSSLGVTGRFQLSCMVHSRETCGRCGKQLKKIRVGGRGTYYCPDCQKKR